VSEPTQTRYPWRATVRTGFQVAVALATLIPYVVTSADIPVSGVLAQVVGVSMAVARVMALPEVTRFLETFAPWLSPTGGTKTPPGDG
jgi:hypothetical protein